MSATASWQDLLARPADGNHMCQIYADEAFLVDAIAHFIATGLRRDAGVVVIATAEHWDACTARLAEQKVSLREAEWRGQLVLLDAEKTLSQFMVGGMPDWKSFQDVVGSAINNVRHRYARVRAFGEMVGILWRRGERRAALRLEELWNHLVKVQDLALCCAYRIDGLADDAYDGALASLCEAHSHIIPAPDYRRLDESVARASKEVLGSRVARMLQSLAAERPPSARMPAGQSMLLWLEENMPLTAPRVLARARAHYHASTS